MAANNQAGLIVLEAFIKGGATTPPNGYLIGNNWTFAKTGTGVFTFTTTDSYDDLENKINLEVLGTAGNTVCGKAVWTSTTVITVHTFGVDGVTATDEPCYLTVTRTRTQGSAG